MTEKERPKDYPTWLKAMQNGSIGEARAKAFLLDRFWVLERSVDIEGADFIIQRRLTGRNLLDREAPRLGVVQVKYFGTSSTQHFVHREYAIDEQNNSRDEFFVLCFLGNEESPRSFLIQAKDLVEQFPQTAKDNNEGFSISYQQVSSDNRFEIINPKFALDRIEKRLEFAEFTKNRRFISWALPSAKNDLTAILPEYAEPIDNWWGDIPSGFEHIKRSAQSALINVEEIQYLLGQLIQEPDPLKAEEIIDDIRYNCRDGLGHWRISLPDDLYDEDFFTVCKKHKEVYENLKKDGLLDSFLNMKKDLRGHLMVNIEPLLPFDANYAHLFSFTYDPDTLTILSFTSKQMIKEDYLKTFNKLNSHSLEGITKYSIGQIEYGWFPSAYGNKEKDVKKKIDWYRSQDFFLYYRCLDAVFSLKYYDDVDL